jgi:hypothetical protein
MKVTSWKTTVIGAILALAVAIQPLLTTGTIDWKQVIIAGLIALLGYVAKDSDVTGGSKKLGTPLKIAVLAIMLSGIGLTANAQFFKPVDKNMFQPKTSFNSFMATPEDNATKWLIRPAVSVSAMQLYYDKATKAFNATSFTSIGFGAGYQHFIASDTEPFNDWGVTALILFEAVPTETTSAGISGAITINALRFVNAGLGYNFQNNKVFLLTGITYNFN